MELSYHYLSLLNHSIYQKKMYEELEELKLSMGQPKIFDFLLEHNGCIQKEIAVGCQIEPASVTSILLTMEKNKYILKKNLKNNRRVHYIYLTEEGEKIAKKVREAMILIEERALENFTEEEKKELLSYMKRVNYNLIGDIFIDKNNITPNKK